MTEYTPEKVADLIARLRHEDAAPSHLWGLGAGEVMRLAADTLEAMAAENESLRRFDWLKRNRGVEAERDEALAVIAELQKGIQRFDAVAYYAEAREILSRIPEHPKED